MPRAPAPPPRLLTLTPMLMLLLALIGAGGALAQRSLPLPPPWPDTVPPAPAQPAPAPPAAAPPAPAPQAMPRPPGPPPEPPVPVRPADAPRGPVTGLPLPRFASLGSNRINLRRGPGTQFPVEWTYRRAGWPVEIVREFDVWRQVRDADGATGWVQVGFLSPRRHGVVRGETRPLLRRPDDAAPAIARLEPGVQARIRRCEAGSPWCEVEVRGNRGWLRRAWFWGTYAGEEVR